MDIILYLTELLQTRKTLGVAGLGTLYKKKSPGKYDAAKHAFIPPSYALAFTSEVKEEDELANYISQKRNITSDSARYYISEFAEQVQAQLADHQEADLGSLGKLKLINDELVLINAQEINFGYEFYGFPTLSEIEEKEEELPVAPLATEEKLNEIEIENKLEEENPGQETENPIEEEYIDLNDDQPVFEEISEVRHQPILEEFGRNEILEPTLNENTVDPISVDEEIQDQNFEEEQKKGTPFFIKFLIVLLIIIAAGAIAYFINPRFFDQYWQKNFESTPAKQLPLASDTLKVNSDSIKTDSIAKNNAMVTLIKDSAVIDTTKKYYEVIGTSENTQAAADKYIARVAKRGITAKHVKLSKTRYSVSLGTFENQKEAMKYADSLRTLLKNPEIYSQLIKPKKTP